MAATPAFAPTDLQVAVSAAWTADPQYDPGALFPRFNAELLGRQWHDANPDDPEIVSLGTAAVHLLDDSRLVRAGRDIVDAADEIGGDLYHMAATCYFNRHPWDVVEVGADGLFIQHVEIGHQWRGQGYGLLLVAQLLQTLGAGLGFGLLRPHPVGGEDNSEHTIDAGTAALARHWSRLGFTEWHEGYWIADLALRDVDNRLTAASAGAPLPPDV